MTENAPIISGTTNTQSTRDIITTCVHRNNETNQVGDSVSIDSSQHVGTKAWRTLGCRVIQLNTLLDENSDLLKQELLTYSNNLETVFKRRRYAMETALGAIGSLGPSEIKSTLLGIQNNEKSSGGDKPSIIEALRTTITKRDLAVTGTDDNGLPSEAEVTQGPEVLKYKPVIDILLSILDKGSLNDIANAYDTDEKLLTAIDEIAGEIAKTKEEVTNSIMNASKLVKIEGDNDFKNYKELLKLSLNGDDRVNGLMPKKTIHSLNIGTPLLLNSTNETAQSSLDEANNPNYNRLPYWVTASIDILKSGSSPLAGLNEDAESRSLIEESKNQVESFINNDFKYTETEINNFDYIRFESDDKFSDIQSWYNSYKVIPNWDTALKKEMLIQLYLELLEQDSSSNQQHHKNIVTLAWQIQMLSKSEDLVGNLASLRGGRVSESSLGLANGSSAQINNVIDGDKASDYEKVTEILNAMDKVEENFKADLRSAAPQSFLNRIETIYDQFFSYKMTQDPLFSITQWHIRKAENFIFQTAVSNKIQDVASEIGRNESAGTNPQNSEDINVGYLLAGTRSLVEELTERKIGSIEALRDQGLQILNGNKDMIQKAGQVFNSGGGR